MEAGIAAEAKGPAGAIIGIDRPFGGEGRQHDRGALGGGEIPLGQPIIERDAGKTVALKSLVGLAMGQRDIGGGHADAQRALRGCGGGAQRGQGGRTSGQEKTSKHGISLDLL